MFKKGFDTDKYLKEQRAYILKRAERHEHKLYIECGGKLLHDLHASRVLPGYDPDVKMRVFSSLTDKIDVILCISAKDIENKKIRADFNRTYSEDVLNIIDDFKKYGMICNKVVITRYTNQASIVSYKHFLTRRGIKVYIHKEIPNYPFNIETIVSDKGYGSNPYIETDKPIVIVTAPGPGSGKLATCLSQLYHDFKNNKNSGYAKFETFPIWNLPIDHPVNLAYESATADLGDVNRIDHFYLEATGKIAVNYNRDLEAFPILKNLLEKISSNSLVYNSPTDMGINRAGFGIIDDECVRKAAEFEIIRRYMKSEVDYLDMRCTQECLNRCLSIMNKANLKISDRAVVGECENKLKEQIKRKKGKDGIVCVGVIEVADNVFISGTNSYRMHASTAMIFNALKYLSSIKDNVDLISKDIIDSVLYMKLELMNEKGTSLNLDEGLICLSLSAARDANARLAISHLSDLAGMEVHMSHIPSAIDMNTMLKLKLNVTSNPQYPSKS